MFLALDIGNSHVTCGIFNEGQWIHILRIPSNLNFWSRLMTLQEYEITNAAISSVVPRLIDAYVQSIKNIFHIEVFVISHKGDTLYDKFRVHMRFEKRKNFSVIV